MTWAWAARILDNELSRGQGACQMQRAPHIREVRRGSDKLSGLPFPWPGTTRHTSYGSPRHCGYHHVASRPASNAARDVGFLKERYPDVTQKLSRVIFNVPSCCNLDIMDGIIIFIIIIDVTTHAIRMHSNISTWLCGWCLI